MKTWARWLWRASLGAPVVPPVWKHAAMSSRAMSPAADQAVRRLGGGQGHEVALRVELEPGRADLQQRAQARHPGRHLLRLGPAAGFVVGAPGDQDLGPRRVHQRGQLVLAQQRVQRHHDAGRLATPQRQVVFEAAGQHHRHRVLRPEAEPVQQVGRAVDAGQQLGIGPALRLGVDRRQEAERGPVAEGPRAVDEQRVGAGHRHRLRQRHALLEPLDVGQAADREGGRERRGRRRGGRRRHGVHAQDPGSGNRPIMRRARPERRSPWRRPAARAVHGRSRHTRYGAPASSTALAGGRPSGSR